MFTYIIYVLSLETEAIHALKHAVLPHDYMTHTRTIPEYIFTPSVQRERERETERETERDRETKRHMGMRPPDDNAEIYTEK